MHTKRQIVADPKKIKGEIVEENIKVDKVLFIISSLSLSLPLFHTAKH